jgi:adenine-specific DNA-methyltransferase
MSEEPDKPQVERIASQSPDLRVELCARLREIVPEAFSEGRLDADKLKALLGENGDIGPERYSFSWAGKRDAIAMLQAPTRATLIPDREHSVNFDEAQHVFIEGENLEVLKVLYRSYFGRVKMIYIDPPYNTGNDFIYPDDFADPLDNYLRITGQKNGNGDYTTSQVEKNGRIHSAWLSMMYPRLSLARQFLREDGFIVISIDDVELPDLERLADEIFGEENRVSVLVYDRNRKNDAKLFSVGHEYMVVYARNKAFIRDLDTELRLPKEGVEEIRAEYERLRKLHADNWEEVRRDLLEYYKSFSDEDPRKPLARYRQVDKDGPYRTDGDISWPGGGGPRYDVPHPKTKNPCKVPKRGWVYSTYERMKEEIGRGMVIFGDDETTIPSLRRNLFERDTQVMRSVIFSYAQVASQQFDAIFDGKKVFENPKSFADLERLVTYLTNPGDIVLDFFAGSNTMMHGVVRASREGLSRRAISVQMAEPIKSGTQIGDNAMALGLRTIADIATERMRRVFSQNGFEKPNNGFLVFRLLPSNFRPWSGISEKNSESVTTQIEAFADSLVPGWKPENVIWEVALREGYSLTSRIEKIPGAGKHTFWRVTDPDREQSFIITLDETLTLEVVRALKLPKNALFVCRDTALDDTLSANLALQCRLKVL